MYHICECVLGLTLCISLHKVKSRIKNKKCKLKGLFLTSTNSSSPIFGVKGKLKSKIFFLKM